MARRALDKEMDKIRRDTIEMAESVSKALKKAMTALENGDKKLANEVIIEDDLVDNYYTHIKKRVIQTIALQQPVAGDLRFIGITLDVAKDLERVGDYAVDIAKAVPFMDRKFEMKEISEMGRVSMEMPIDATDAFIHHDMEKRGVILEKEEMVDKLYSSIFPKILKHLSGGDMGRAGLNAILIGKYLERIADHCVNIAERTMYAISGDKKYL